MVAYKIRNKETGQYYKTCLEDVSYPFIDSFLHSGWFLSIKDAEWDMDYYGDLVNNYKQKKKIADIKKNFEQMKIVAFDIIESGPILRSWSS